MSEFQGSSFQEVIGILFIYLFIYFGGGLRSKWGPKLKLAYFLPEVRKGCPLYAQ